MGVVVDLLAELLEVLVLDDAGVGHGGISVVYHGVALVVGLGLHLGLEAHCAEVEMTVTILEELIELAGVDDHRRHLLPMGAVVEEVGVGAGVDTLQQSVDEAVVASHGNALVEVVEIVVVVDQPHRQSLDDEGGQLGALAPPLLLGVALDEALVDVAADERESLLLEVARLGGSLGAHLGQGLGALLLDLGCGLLGCYHAPHLVERVHVERQVVEPSLVVGHGRVGVSVEGHDAVDKVPHALVGGVEDVGAILVDVDALHILAIDVAAEVRALVDDKATGASLMGEVGEGGTEEAGAHDEVVVRIRHGMRCLGVRYVDETLGLGMGVDVLVDASQAFALVEQLLHALEAVGGHLPTAHALDIVFHPVAEVVLLGLVLGRAPLVLLEEEHHGVPHLVPAFVACHGL